MNNLIKQGYIQYCNSININDPEITEQLYNYSIKELFSKQAADGDSPSMWDQFISWFSAPENEDWKNAIIGGLLGAGVGGIGGYMSTGTGQGAMQGATLGGLGGLGIGGLFGQNIGSYFTSSEEELEEESMKEQAQYNQEVEPGRVGKLFEEKEKNEQKARDIYGDPTQPVMLDLPQEEAQPPDTELETAKKFYQQQDRENSIDQPQPQPPLQTQNFTQFLQELEALHVYLQKARKEIIENAQLGMQEAQEASKDPMRAIFNYTRSKTPSMTHGEITKQVIPHEVFNIYTDNYGNKAEIPKIPIQNIPVHERDHIKQNRIPSVRNKKTNLGNIVRKQILQGQLPQGGVSNWNKRFIQPSLASMQQGLDRRIMQDYTVDDIAKGRGNIDSIANARKALMSWQGK